MRNQKWVKIAPHVIDTLLLTLGVVMAFNIGASLFDGWLGAKLLGLLAYIGFGVVTMRADSQGVKIAAFIAALVCVATCSPWPSPAHPGRWRRSDRSMPQPSVRPISSFMISLVPP